MPTFVYYMFTYFIDVILFVFTHVYCTLQNDVMFFQFDPHSHLLIDPEALHEANTINLSIPVLVQHVQNNAPV